MDTFLIDYGYSEKVSLENLILSERMPEEFSSKTLSPQSFVCGLANIEPADGKVLIYMFYYLENRIKVATA